MVANFSRIHACADIDELVFLHGHVREAARSFAELAERFRLAPSRSRTPSVLKHEVNSVFAVQAGELLWHCWRRGRFSVYRPHFCAPEGSESRLRYAITWFTFIRWHLAPIFNNRFRPDWQSEFAPGLDQIKGQKDGPPPDITAAVSDDAKELAVWRLDLCADVQATACAILAEELELLLETIERRLGLLPADPEGGDADEQEPAGDAPAAVRLLNIYTNGLADERLEKASNILNSDMKIDEKLWKIDKLMPIPPTVSGEKLGCIGPAI